MEELPNEMLFRILSYLDTPSDNYRNLFAVEQVSSKLKQVVGIFWNRKMRKWIGNDYQLHLNYAQAGWNRETEDNNLNSSLTKKTLDIYSIQQKPQIRNYRTNAVEIIAVYKEKIIFLALANFSIESRNIKDFTLRKVLKSNEIDNYNHDENQGHPNYFQLAIHGHILAAARKSKLYLFNAEIEAMIFQCDINPIVGLYLKLDLNSKSVIVSSNGYLLIWKVDQSKRKVHVPSAIPEIVQDITIPSYQFQDSFSHCMKINEDVIVTYDCYDEEQDPNVSFSSLHIRRFESSGSVGPLMTYANNKDITKLTIFPTNYNFMLSDSVTNLLAVWTCDHSVDIFDIVSGDRFFQIPFQLFRERPSNLMAYVHFMRHLQWLDSKLFILIEGNDSASGDILIVWDATTKQMNTAHLFQGILHNDLLNLRFRFHISRSQIIVIDNQDGERIEKRVTIHDFWNNDNNHSVSKPWWCLIL